MARVHERDDAVEPVTVLHLVVHEERLCHWAGIGEARRLDQHVIELVAPLHQVAEDADEIAAHGATDAAVVHLEDFLVGVDNQRVVYADLAEFIFNDGDAFAVVLGENAIEQRGFARAEKTGQDGNRDAGVSFGWIHIFYLSTGRQSEQVP